MTRWFTCLVITTKIAASPSFIAQIVSTLKPSCIVVYQQGEQIFNLKIGDRFFQYHISDITYRYVYLIDHHGVESNVMVGSPIFFQSKIKPKYENSVFITSQQIDDLKKQDLFTILEHAASEPYYDSYEQIGYRIFDINEGSVFETIGIKNGDIITHINDYGLDSISKTIDILRQTDLNERIIFKFLRDNIEGKTTIDIGY